MDFYSKHAERLASLYDSVPSDEVHRAWFHLLPATHGFVLDVGAGTGRDAAWLASSGHEVVAVEPSHGMRRLAQEHRASSSIQWLDDSLPALQRVHDLDLKFDLVLLSAVWMHVAPSDRDRAFRKMVGLLKPGGLLVVTLRHGPSPDERVMHPVPTEDFLHLASRFALEVAVTQDGPDLQGRPEVSWTTVVLRLIDDGTGALPLLRHIVLNDRKAATYKLGLLRAVLRAAAGAQGAVLDRDETHVVLPFGLVALYWIKAFRPLVLDHRYRQQPEGNKGLSFAREAFRGLEAISPYDLRVGARFHGREAEVVFQALRDCRNTIAKMPAFYTTFPGTDRPVFECESRPVRARGSIELNLDFLSELGSFRVPINLWEAMTRYACWIEPAVVGEWANLMAGYDSRAGDPHTLDEYMKAMQWLDPEHSTTEVRAVVDSLRTSGKPIYCVWSGRRLAGRYAVDHSLPFAAWPNNDLWNLVPSHPSINASKSCKLPSAQLLEASKERLVEWWHGAYVGGRFEDRFRAEAVAAIPGLKTAAGGEFFEHVYRGVQNQRARLKVDQQLEEYLLPREPR